MKTWQPTGLGDARAPPDTLPDACTRAVVIGAGMAGLAAARVLSDHFDEVVLLERDQIDSAPGDQVRFHKRTCPGLATELLILGACTSSAFSAPSVALRALRTGPRVHLCSVLLELRSTVCHRSPCVCCTSLFRNR